MNKYKPTKSRSDIRLFAVLFISFNITSLASFSVYSVGFESGDFSGNVDTTLSYGQSYRTSGQDGDIIGTAGDPAGVGLTGTGGSVTGSAFSENSDDGNQNYDEGPISRTAKFTTEVDLTYKNFGLFSRFNGFKDYENLDSGDRLPLSSKANRLVTQNLNLQDLYVWGNFNVGSMPVSIRVGEQVLSWGESTFIQNGINVINPFDVSKLRTPGSEVRDALTPVGMVSLSIEPFQNLSFDAYYQYDWERTIIEPTGSFFSTNDFVGDGGNKVLLGFGDVSDRGRLFGPATAGAINFLAGFTAVDPSGFDSDFNTVTRTADVRPGNGGEFGFALKYLFEELNDTEFGLYFINHHSRTPIISAKTGTAAGIANAGAVFAGTVGALGAATAFGLAVDQYAQTANYLIEYPEDIQRFGFSFNTQVKGIAFQGEYTLIHDAPLQVDDIELLFAALCPINAFSGGAIGMNQIDSTCAKYGAATETVIPGFIERNVSQFQVTATQIFGPMLKANQGALVGEVGVTHVHGMPDKSDLRLNSAGTFTSGNAFHSGTTTGLHGGKAFEAAENFADATSWGYRIAGRLTYNNLIGPINVTPRFAFSHDVSGNTPGPGGNFLEDRKAVTLGLGLDYQNKWQAGLSYTNFFGAGRHNLLNDRDFMAFNMTYSF